MTNQRILKLAHAAGLGERWNTTAEFERFLEQFANEIIQECINEVSDLMEYEAEGNDLATLRLVRKVIKEHFGVGSPVRTPVVTISQEEKEALSNWGTLE